MTSPIVTYQRTEHINSEEVEQHMLYPVMLSQVQLGSWWVKSVVQVFLFLHIELALRALMHFLALTQIL